MINFQFRIFVFFEVVLIIFVHMQDESQDYSPQLLNGYGE